jgi:hypothetical protein
MWEILPASACPVGCKITVAVAPEPPPPLNATVVLHPTGHADAGKISHINVTAGGSGYSSAPTVVFSGSAASGSGHSGVAVVGDADDSLLSRGTAAGNADAMLLLWILADRTKLL